MKSWEKFNCHVAIYLPKVSSYLLSLPRSFMLFHHEIKKEKTWLRIISFPVQGSAFLRFLFLAQFAAAVKLFHFISSNFYERLDSWKLLAPR